MSKQSHIYAIQGGNWYSTYVLWKFRRNGKPHKNEGAARAQDAALGFRVVRRCG